MSGKLRNTPATDVYPYSLDSNRIIVENPNDGDNKGVPFSYCVRRDALILIKEDNGKKQLLWWRRRQK